MCNKVAVLEQDLGNANQYSRRHCVIVSNVPETEEESTDDIIQIAKDNGSNIVCQISTGPTEMDLQKGMMVNTET
ncbi:hypothetical protein DPMN_074691 [Dreissena polymorpha]|uniref:Uncharacterized protein n=1 Tax=Dreissena polymorpha TaxID=45954 RepID=A0A9D3YI65_DREPO|nr:hypothetical protein DPMN_074691 [Dreissena polymorpha]